MGGKETIGGGEPIHHRLITPIRLTTLSRSFKKMRLDAREGGETSAMKRKDQVVHRVRISKQRGEIHQNINQRSVIEFIWEKYLTRRDNRRALNLNKRHELKPYSRGRSIQYIGWKTPNAEKKSTTPQEEQICAIFLLLVCFQERYYCSGLAGGDGLRLRRRSLLWEGSSKNKSFAG